MPGLNVSNVNERVEEYELSTVIMHIAYGLFPVMYRIKHDWRCCLNIRDGRYRNMRAVSPAGSVQSSGDRKRQTKRTYDII